MRPRSTPRRFGTAVEAATRAPAGAPRAASFLLAAALLALPACGAAEGRTGAATDRTGAAGGRSGPESGAAADPSAVGTTPGETSAAESPRPALDPDAPCALLTRSELATVFDHGVPEPEETSYGAGFAECLWKDGTDQHVRLSVVPLGNLRSDYLDQLTARVGVVGLGAGSVTYSGTVGIGHAKRGGITAAFPAADVGVLLAVKTGDGTDEKADLIHVTVLGQRLLSRTR